MIRLLLFSLLVACGTDATAGSNEADDVVTEAAPIKKGQAQAVLAGGCFWCMESSLEALPGVIEVESGYSGGKAKPTYYEVGSGKTGHYEVVRVIYDPKKLTYEALLTAFWHNVDPTQDDGQFCDRGPQYRSAIFVASDTERKIAEKTKKEAAKTLGRSLVTPVLDAQTFWLAEGYHQDFYKKNPAHYMRYRVGCGRDRRLKELWGAAADH